MIDTKEMARLYTEEYCSMTELSDMYNLDRRKVKRILSNMGVKLRSSKKSYMKAYRRKTQMDREERVYPHKDHVQTKDKGLYKTNPQQEQLLINIYNGADDSRKLSEINHGYVSLSNTLRILRGNGLIEYESKSGSYAKNIKLTKDGMSRIYEPSLKQRIIQLYENNAELDYVDIAEIVRCNHSYPSRVIKKYLVSGK